MAVVSNISYGCVLIYKWDFVKDFCNVTLLQEETFKISPQGWEKNTKPLFFFPLLGELGECPESIIVKGIVGDVFAQIKCHLFLLILCAPNAHFIALNSSLPVESFTAKEK